jgi:hypothetical protein
MHPLQAGCGRRRGNQHAAMDRRRTRLQKLLPALAAGCGRGVGVAGGCTLCGSCCLHAGAGLSCTLRRAAGHPWRRLTSWR